MSLDAPEPSVAARQQPAARTAMVRWSWRLLAAFALSGVALVPAVLSGLILPSRLLLLGLVPLAVLGMTASGTALLLLGHTCPREARRVASRPAAVPRQFGIGPMLLLVTLYAVVFSMLQSIDASPTTYAFVATFLAAVILSQVLLFRGKQPRKASALAGLAAGGLLGFAVLVDSLPSLSRLQDPLYLALYLFYAPLNLVLIVAVAVAVAYLGGCLVSGIFLLRHRLDTGSWTIPTEEPSPGDACDSQPSGAAAPVHRDGVPASRMRLRRIGALTIVSAAVLALTWYVPQARRFIRRWEALIAIRQVQGYVERSYGSGTGADKEFRTSTRDQVHWLKMILSGIDNVVFYHRDLPWDQLAAIGHFDTLRIRSEAPLRETDLVRLQEMPCDALEIDFTGITDDGLLCLKRLTCFSRLSVDLTGLAVTDAALESLVDVPNLDRLVLTRTPINDASLAIVARLPRLRSLDLANTGVSNAGLEHLNGLTRLKTLRLRDTQVTRQAVQRLANRMPWCNLFGPGRARVQPQDAELDEESPAASPDQPVQ